MGPFYRPGAPERDSIGHGYKLSGTVRRARGCAPLPDARIEFWMAGPEGVYDDAHRATVIAGREGRYRFETDFPPVYIGRPPHIHIRVSAAGLPPLVTQHYPAPGAVAGELDLILPAGD